MRIDERRGSIALEQEMRGDGDAIARDHAQEDEPPGAVENADQKKDGTSHGAHVVKGARAWVHVSAQVVGPELTESAAVIRGLGHGEIASRSSPRRASAMAK